MAGTRDHDELGIRDRVLELVCHGERRARVQLPQISRVGTAMCDSRSRWSASAITDSAVVMLSGRTSLAIASMSDTTSGGGSAGTALEASGRTSGPARQASAGGPRPAPGPPPRAATLSPRRACRRGAGSRRARAGGDRAPARRCRPRTARRHAPAPDRALRPTPRGSRRSPPGRNPRAHPRSDPPPGSSQATTVNSSARAASCGCHMRASTAAPCRNTSSGPSPTRS